MNKITIAGLVICIGGFICAFACIACSTAWPTVISILIGSIIGIPLICYGVTQGTTSIKQSDGAKITVTENNERILKNKGFYISKICKFTEIYLIIKSIQHYILMTKINNGLSVIIIQVNSKFTNIQT